MPKKTKLYENTLLKNLSANDRQFSRPNWIKCYDQTTRINLMTQVTITHKINVTSKIHKTQTPFLIKKLRKLSELTKERQKKTSESKTFVSMLTWWANNSSFIASSRSTRKKKFTVKFDSNKLLRKEYFRQRRRARLISGEVLLFISFLIRTGLMKI